MFKTPPVTKNLIIINVLMFAMKYVLALHGIALDDLSMQPLSKGGQLVPNIVYSLQPTAIRHVVVNGETTFADGAFTKIDESELLARIRETMTYLED